MKKPELLAPAGNLEKLKIALTYGADAVYLGGKAYGLRAFSDNFTSDDVIEGVAYTHALGRRVYVTVNIIPHNDDLADLPEYIRFLADAGVDALIVADPGVFSLARSVAPELPLHISTQANNTNWASVKFWQAQGAKRIVLACELSLSEIQGIREKNQVELESFVHGAMCISYSGRCLLSNYMTGRDANRGECAQACRWKYAVVEETRPGQYFPVLEDERGTYVFNSRDLCLLPHIGELAAAGLDSLKIEGRMKSVHYVATVVKVYREALDSYYTDPAGFAARPEWLSELEKISHRAYTTGFAFAKTTAADQIYDGRTYQQTHDFIGLVHSYDPLSKTAVVEQRNNMKTGEKIEIMRPGQANFQQTISRMTDLEGNEIQVAPHAQQLVKMDVVQPVAPFSMLRRQVTHE